MKNLIISILILCSISCFAQGLGNEKDTVVFEGSNYWTGRGEIFDGSHVFLQEPYHQTIDCVCSLDSSGVLVFRKVNAEMDGFGFVRSYIKPEDASDCVQVSFLPQNEK